MNEEKDLVGKISETSKEFSLLVHHYFKLSCIRIMQDMREKYDLHEDDMPTLLIAVFTRMLSESCYAVHDYTINEILRKEKRLVALKVLSGEKIEKENMKHTEEDLDIAINNFKKFILEKGGDFRIDT